MNDLTTYFRQIAFIALIVGLGVVSVHVSYGRGTLRTIDDFANTPSAERFKFWLQPYPLIQGAEEEAAFLKGLQHEDPVVRRFAALHLGEVPHLSTKAADALIGSLQDADQNVRWQVVSSLMRQGEDISRELIKLLDDRSSLDNYTYFSRSANWERTIILTRADLAALVLVHMETIDIKAIVNAYEKVKEKEGASAEANELRKRSDIGPGSAQFFSRLLGLLQDAVKPEDVVYLATLMTSQDPRLSEFAYATLGKIGPQATAVAPALEKQLLAEDSANRSLAALTLARLGQTGLNILIQSLGNSRDAVRAAVYPALIWYADNPEDFLKRGISDPSEQVKAAVYRSLALYKEDHRALLLRGLDDLSESVQSELLARLVRYDHLLSGLELEAIVHLLESSNREVVKLAWRIVARANANKMKEIQGKIDQLAIAILKGRDQDFVESALEVLTKTDKALPYRSPQVANDLVEIIHNDRQYQLLNQAAQVLSRLGPNAESVYPDLLRALKQRSYVSESMLEALTSIGRKRVAIREDLAHFLMHPNFGTKLAASKTLLKHQWKTTDVTDALKSLVFDDKERIYERYNVAELLIKTGPKGVAFLRELLKDRSKPTVVRKMAIHGLSKAAKDNTDLIDELAKTSLDDNAHIREMVIRRLPDTGAPARVINKVFDQALKDSNYRVQEAVLETLYHQPDLPVLNAVRHGILSLDKDIRWEATNLIRRIPEDNQNRIKYIRRALNDEYHRIRNDAFHYLPFMKEAGVVLLTEALSGKYRKDYVGGYNFLGIMKRFGSQASTTIPALLKLLKEVDTPSRLTVLEAIGVVGGGSKQTEEVLYAALTSPEPKERDAAISALLKSGADPWAHNALLANVIVESEIPKQIRKRLEGVIEVLRPYFGLVPSSMTPGSALPDFPWPPPEAAHKVLVAREYFGDINTTLGDVSKRLVDALEQASEDFEYGLFGKVPGGFALVARMERIHRDGSPFQGELRWMKGRLPVLSFRDYLVRLFMEKPGFFRVIAFIVTDEHGFGFDESAKLPEITYGAKILPSEIAEKKMGNKQCYALIYTFQRRTGGDIRLGYDGSPSGKRHLSAAGVWGGLVSRPDS